MVLSLAEHDSLLTELMETEDSSRRVEIGSALRADYNDVVTTSETATKSIEELTKQNEDVRLAYSKLWRQVGPSSEGTNDPDPEFSQTATLEDIERKFN